MDEEILYQSEEHEPVESAEEVYKDSETVSVSNNVETAEEVGPTEQEPSAADYAAQFGENVVYREEYASDSISYAGESGSSGKEIVYIPVLDEAARSSIFNTESNTNSILEYISTLDMYLSRIDEAIPEFDHKISHIESDVRQMGKNDILFQKLSAGLIAALLGAIIVIIFFSKFR